MASDPQAVAAASHEAEQQAPELKRLPFGFAKRHGVLLLGLNSEAAQLQCRESISSLSLAELRRYFGVPLKLEVMADNVFDQLLQQSYESGSAEAFDMMGSMGDEDDLSSIAEALDEPEDLLESEDDAPIIRLLNALLTQAIKEGASDIHLDTFEGRMVVRFRVDGVSSQGYGQA